MNNSAHPSLSGTEQMINSLEHEKFMHRAIQLAKNGVTGAPPNPMVGAVIVHRGRIIGEGYHRHVGQAHAEVNAIHSVRKTDKALLSEATIYVTLEPCSHFGRTPPCAQLIVRTGIPRVVVGCQDPFVKVSGRGIQMLRDAGVEVCVGILEKECRQLIRKFIIYHEQHRPYVTLKWARSRDGFIDRWRSLPDTEVEVQSPLPAPARLSTAATQIAVHHQRALHKAILVGHSTLLLDKPRLDVRAWWGERPHPVVLGRLSEEELPAGWQCFADIPTLLHTLYEQGMDSLLVEGGQHTLQAFIDGGYWDEAWEELSEVELSEGIPAPRMPVSVNKDIVQKFGHYFLHWENA